MAPNVRDEVYPNPARPFIVQIPEQPKWPKMSFEFFPKDGCALATPSIPGLLRAEEDQREVRAGARRELVRSWERIGKRYWYRKGG